MVFDKTGTLTRGKPFLTDVVSVPSPALDRLVAASPAAAAVRVVAPAPGPDAGAADSASSPAAAAAAAAAAVLALAAACEAYSEHPVGRAMVDAAAAAAEESAAAAAAVAAAAAAAASSKNKSEGDNTTTQQQQQQQHGRQHQPLSTLPEVGTGLENGVSFNGTGAGAGAGADGVTEFVSEPGCGVACQHPLGRVCVGTRAWAESNGGKRNKVVRVSKGGEERDSLEAADAIMRGEWMSACVRSCVRPCVCVLLA